MDDLELPDLTDSDPLTTGGHNGVWPFGGVPMGAFILVSLAVAYGAWREASDAKSKPPAQSTAIERVAVTVERNDAGDIVYRLRGRTTSSPADLAREIAPIRGPKPPVDLTLGPGVSPGDLHATLDALDAAGYDEVRQTGD